MGIKGLPKGFYDRAREIADQLEAENPHMTGLEIALEAKNQAFEEWLREETLDGLSTEERIEDGIFLNTDEIPSSL